MGAGIKFNPASDMPDLAGKVIFITGGTAGLGKLSVLHFARKNPEHIFFSGRNATRAAEVIAEAKEASPNTKVSFIKMDLASLKSVQTGTTDFLSKSSRLDILMCNAAILGVAPALTEDGYEVQMGTNHLGHALLMKLLLPTMQKTSQEGGDVRIISNSSEAYNFAMGTIHYNSLHKADDFNFLGGWRRYGESKLANALYSAEFARRYPNIVSVSIHPGIIGTDMINDLGTGDKILLGITTFGERKTPEEGVVNQLWAATADKDKIVNGAYYKPVGVKGFDLNSNSMVKGAKKLWEWTEKELEGYKA